MAAACTQGSIVEPTQASLTGTWNLQSMNGTPLPFAISQFGGKKVEIIADVLTITAPNTFAEVTTVRTTQNGTATTENITDRGTYTFDSLIVTFVFNSNGSNGLGTMSKSTLTVATSGVSFFYKKQ